MAGFEVTVKRWRGGSWSAACLAEDGRATLVESDGRATVRVVTLVEGRCTEAMAQPLLLRRGLGRALVAGTLGADGTRQLEAHRVFPNGTVRDDRVLRRGHEGERTSEWLFANGSRITAKASPGRQVVELFTRAGEPAGRRSTVFEPTDGGVARLTVVASGADGRETARRTGMVRIAQGQRSVTLSDEGTGQRVMDDRVALTPDSGTDGREVTRGADGTLTFTTTTTGPGIVMQDSISVDATGAVSMETDTRSETEDGVTCTSDVTRVTSDGTVINSTGVYGDNPDGSWTGTGQTTVDGQVVSETGHAEDATGTFVSDTRVDYDADGGGVIVVTTRNTETGETSTTVDGFDKDGNPRDPNAPHGDGGGDGGQGGGGGGDGGGQGGGDGGGGDGGGGDGGGGDGGGEGDGGGDSGGGPPSEESGDGDGGYPSDDGSEEGPHFGGHLTGSGGLGSLDGLGGFGRGGGTGGGGDPGDGEGDDFDTMHSALLGQVKLGGRAGGGVTSGGDDGGGLGDDTGPEGPPVIHFKGGRGALVGQGGQTDPDGWGDLNNPRALTGFAAAAFGVALTGALNRAIGAAERVGRA